jgi:amidase
VTRTVDGPHPRRKPEKSKAVSLPTPSQLHAAASEVGLDLTDADVTSFIELMRPRVAAYNIVDAMPDNLPEVRYARTPGHRPMGEENTHNAWYVKTRVEGASAGKLRNRTVVLKDNIMLAGVPMMNGSATLQGYVPGYRCDSGAPRA